MGPRQGKITPQFMVYFRWSVQGPPPSSFSFLSFVASPHSHSLPDTSTHSDALDVSLNMYVYPC